MKTAAEGYSAWLNSDAAAEWHAAVALDRVTRATPEFAEQYKHEDAEKCVADFARDRDAEAAAAVSTAERQVALENERHRNNLNKIADRRKRAIAEAHERFERRQDMMFNFNACLARQGKPPSYRRGWW